MTYALLAALALVNVVWALLYRFQMDASASLLASEMEAFAREQDRHAEQVSHLLQRIQAPEYAVVEHAQRQAVEDDPNPYPKSEQETAAGMGVTQALIAEIERMERNGVDMHMPQG